MRLVIAVPLIALALYALIYAAKRYSHYREQRELRIRHEETVHFTFVPPGEPKERE